MYEQHGRMGIMMRGRPLPTGRCGTSGTKLHGRIFERVAGSHSNAQGPPQRERQSQRRSSASSQPLRRIRPKIAPEPIRGALTATVAATWHLSDMFESTKTPTGETNRRRVSSKSCNALVGPSCRPPFVNGSNGMAETATIEMQDRELFALACRRSSPVVRGGQRT